MPELHPSAQDPSKIAVVNKPKTIADATPDATPKKDENDLSFLNADEPTWAKDEPEANPETPAAPAKPAHPKYLRDLASEFGVAQDQIDSFTPDQLGEAVEKIVKERKAEKPQARQASPQHPPSLLHAALKLGLGQNHIDGMSTDDLTDLVLRFRDQSQPAQAPAAPATDDDDAALEYMEKELGADSRVVSLMRKQVQRTKEIEATLAKSRERERTVRQNAGEEAVDAAFERLGPKYEKVLGNGNFRGMKDGPQKEKRLIVFHTAGIDFEADSERTIERKIQAAATRAFGDLLPSDTPAPTPEPQANAYEQPKANGKPNGKPSAEEWDEAALAKPTSSDPKLTPRQKTHLQAMREYMRERGITNKDEFAVFDGVPE